MIELGEMAELVHDDVIGDLWRKKYYFVIEIKVPYLGATSPPRFMILNEYFS